MIEVQKVIDELISNGITNEELVERLKADSYNFNWKGKLEAKIKATQLCNKKMIPCKEDSVDFNKTENLYIEGDNFDVLRLLKNDYSNKIKMIYIEPPYNTGKDFVYKDNWKQTKTKYKKHLGLKRSDVLTPAQEFDRVHSDWLSMMYERLLVSRDLLRDDGVIFISIDDNEVHNLRKLCDEIFGEVNFVGNIVRATGTTTGQDANKIGSSFDSLLVYRKSIDFELYGLPLSNEDFDRFKEEDEKGKYSLLQLRKTGNADRREDRPLMYYPIITPDGTEVFPIGPTGYESRWRVGKTKYQILLEDNLIVWKTNRGGNLTPYVKYYLEGRTKQVSNLWKDIDGNKKGSIELKELLNYKIFDNPKPTDFLNRILTVSSERNDIILDFFSGSATTAHAVMQLNSVDGGNRKHICVQLDEKTDEKSEAYKAGYKNICEIGKERIRRAGKKILEDNESSKQPKDLTNLDIGFRVLKVDKELNDY